jgi:hypothetical protein
MNRRGFIRFFGGALTATAAGVLVPELLSSGRTYFLPPKNGWITVGDIINAAYEKIGLTAKYHVDMVGPLKDYLILSEELTDNWYSKVIRPIKKGAEAPLIEIPNLEAEFIRPAPLLKLDNS